MSSIRRRGRFYSGPAEVAPGGSATPRVTRSAAAATADPADPAAMREGYHMGDHLHGSDAGLRAVGESIDLSLFAAD